MVSLCDNYLDGSFDEGLDKVKLEYMVEEDYFQLRLQVLSSEKIQTSVKLRKDSGLLLKLMNENPDKYPIKVQERITSQSENIEDLVKVIEVNPYHKIRLQAKIKLSKLDPNNHEDLTSKIKLMSKPFEYMNQDQLIEILHEDPDIETMIETLDFIDELPSKLISKLLQPENEWDFKFYEKLISKFLRDPTILLQLIECNPIYFVKIAAIMVFPKNQGSMLLNYVSILVKLEELGRNSTYPILDPEYKQIQVEDELLELNEGDWNKIYSSHVIDGLRANWLSSIWDILYHIRKRLHAEELISYLAINFYNLSDNWMLTEILEQILVSNEDPIIFEPILQDIGDDNMKIVIDQLQLSELLILNKTIFSRKLINRSVKNSILKK